MESHLEITTVFISGNQNLQEIERNMFIDSKSLTKPSH